MKLSNRITGLTEDGSGGWGLFFKARAMKEAGVDVAELTIGEHDIRTHPTILEAMNRSAKAGHTGYATIEGTDGLRAAVAQRISRRTGVATGPENVLITPGGQAALFAAHHAVCDAGDTALYIDPYYATYPGTIRAVGALPRAVPTRPEDRFQPDAGVLARAAPGASSLLINTPNNPTGVIYSRATLQGIADVVQANDMWLISDEVYDTQVWEGEHISPRALPGMEGCTLVVGSMSKSHAMTGSRLGWLVGPEHAIAHLTTLATHTTYGVPGYIQDAGLFALEQGPALEEEIGAPFRRRRMLAQKLLAGQNHLRLVPSSGAMYLMLDVRATGQSGEDFAQDLLEREHIAVMPGESFGRAAAGHIRVAMTLPDEAFAAALTRLITFAGARVSA